ncbi:MobB Molybdopterin-guanine dinucleotide biosynthesis protein [Rhabdaerophilaceae bacterium]
MRVIGLVGWSGAGKTTLVAKLIPALIARGFCVSTIKHAHHGFDVDTPGKDSHIHRMVGAHETLVSSSTRFALIHEMRGAPEFTLKQLLKRLEPADLVLIEGFKRENHAKLEVFRSANAKPPLHPGDPHIKAIVSDIHFPNSVLPQVALEDIELIADLADRFAEPVEMLLKREA